MEKVVPMEMPMRMGTVYPISISATLSGKGLPEEPAPEESAGQPGVGADPGHQALELGR